MKKLLTEAFSVNLILVLMLLSLAGFVRSRQAAQTFAAGSGAVYQVDSENKTVSLMINVYEHPEIVEEYLKIFREKNVRATFFVGGLFAEKNGETVKHIAEAGQELGNHGYRHKLHTKISREESCKEIRDTNALLKKLTGQKITLFAPPSGDVNEAVVKDAASCGCRTIMWTADTIDWRDQDTGKIMGRIKRNLKPGALILMHPTEATLSCLPEILTYLSDNGYEILPVGEHLKA